jgi:hypothetical protein
MPTSSELTSARHLVYQGVGRNLLQFQQLEHLLKYLLGYHQGSYTPETMFGEMKRRHEAQDKKTLGMIAGDLFEKVILKQNQEDVVSSTGAARGEIGHRFEVIITEEVHQEWRSRLKALVDERNELVHLSLLTWDLDTIEGCQAVVAELDKQRGRIGTELEKVKLHHESFFQCLKHLYTKLMESLEKGSTN